MQFRLEHIKHWDLSNSASTTVLITPHQLIFNMGLTQVYEVK